MPVKSYLVIPAEGRKEALKKEIEALPGCEVTPAENRSLLVVLTEAEHEEADKALFEQLNALADLQMLTLVSAFTETASTIDPGLQSA
jgi:nitrate reductase NapAB chaperone NapD